jgi:hypothetical protein
MALKLRHSTGQVTLKKKYLIQSFGITCFGGFLIVWAVMQWDCEGGGWSPPPPFPHKFIETITCAGWILHMQFLYCLRPARYESLPFPMCQRAWRPVVLGGRKRARSLCLWRQEGERRGSARNSTAATHRYSWLLYSPAYTPSENFEPGLKMRGGEGGDFARFFFSTRKCICRAKLLGVVEWGGEGGGQWEGAVRCVQQVLK